MKPGKRATELNKQSQEKTSKCFKRKTYPSQGMWTANYLSKGHQETKVYASSSKGVSRTQAKELFWKRFSEIQFCENWKTVCETIKRFMISASAEQVMSVLWTTPLQLPRIPQHWGGRACVTSMGMNIMVPKLMHMKRKSKKQWEWWWCGPNVDRAQKRSSLGLRATCQLEATQVESKERKNPAKWSGCFEDANGGVVWFN